MNNVDLEIIIRCTKGNGKLQHVRLWSITMQDALDEIKRVSGEWVIAVNIEARILPAGTMGE